MRQGTALGTAWSAPVVAFAGAAPALAQSSDCEQDTLNTDVWGNRWAKKTVPTTGSNAYQTAGGTYTWPTLPDGRVITMVASGTTQSGAERFASRAGNINPTVGATGNPGMRFGLIRIGRQDGKGAQLNLSFFADGAPIFVEDLTFTISDIDGMEVNGKPVITEPAIHGRELLYLLNRSNFTAVAEDPVRIIGDGTSAAPRTPNSKTLDNISDENSNLGNVYVSANVPVSSVDIVKWDNQGQDTGDNDRSPTDNYFSNFRFTVPCA
ncbi:hypothetical protein [Ornithinimicrobium sp. INDO-MA30-4]|uniref:hypothetical protein n=1 Tax=Ornithinimicrobium sp. INDO-MA30-4 TaxID=2908651 RepID=UPI001F1EDBC9|nr:hypothetical protein [Ornithinimicrobium sp. INDO-MA30-4]UJH70316.1 hypothetical protein L0A91_14425 [Ornithinimicrobium sp. INDO-MA30-4]